MTKSIILSLFAISTTTLASDVSEVLWTELSSYYAQETKISVLDSKAIGSLLLLREAHIQQRYKKSEPATIEDWQRAIGIAIFSTPVDFESVDRTIYSHAFATTGSLFIDRTLSRDLIRIRLAQAKGKGKDYLLLIDALLAGTKPSLGGFTEDEMDSLLGSIANSCKRFKYIYIAHGVEFPEIQSTRSEKGA